MSNVSRWLRGNVSVSPHRSYVSLRLEREYGSVRAEVYLTRREAKALRDDLDWLLRPPASSDKEKNR